MPRRHRSPLRPGPGPAGRRPVIAAAVLALTSPVAAGGGDEQEKTSRISDEAVPEIEADPRHRRPGLILELGNPFLGSGDIPPGLELPGGAVLQPSLWIFGTYRTAIQTFNDGDETFSEWANRLDVFANLQLTGTERILLGIRALDDDGRFTGYNLNPEDGDGSVNEFNANVTTLFFEGDFGEIFPDLDPDDGLSLDLGFAVGRQPLFFQEGMLINDNIDAIGITRNTLLPKGGSDLQLTFLYGWGDIHRDDNIEETGAQLFGGFLTADFPKTTINADFVYVYNHKTSTDGAYWGVSGVQRIGHFNTSFRLLGSHALQDESAAVSSGYLLFAEASWTPAWTHDNVYVNAFWGLDSFSSAARDPASGGPLGRTGILFAAVGLGRYGAALGNRADDSVGAAIGYQLFLDETRKQLIVELGGRTDTTSRADSAFALGARYQQAIGQNLVLQLDAFGSVQESREEAFGARVELRFEF